MNTRRAEVEITYNGAAVTSKMADYKGEITYTDPATGEADSLDIAINDRNRKWTTAWVPTTGDTMTATIKVRDWEREGDNRVLSCGFFILDNFEFAGWPVTGTISGVSVPADGSFMATERTRTWENVTIQEIGKEIAARAGIALAWDVEGTPFTIKSVEQSEETDCDFYASLCDTYGLAMKVYAQKIVVYDREAYKKKDPVATINETALKSWSWSKNMAGTYTGGEYAYTDPTTEKEIKATVGTGTRILKQSGKADSKADAERKIAAAVNKANHGASKLSVTITGNAALVASQCITVVGLGKLSGKYFIDSIAHHVGGSGGYTMDMELSLVETMTEEVIKDACQRLFAVGVMASPEYWVGTYKNLNNLDGLLLNMATRIKVNLHGTSVTTVEQALVVLTNTGVINSPEYWASKYTAIAWLDVLLISAANALAG
ncbi:MAG: hypothetical protein MSB10_12935 [Clostridiales bacterium]|uniref:phage late control D family protein n=1 Tax=Flavonifractor porci TaxID=3133422 RepID=UPI0030AAEDCB|nr:hypothetical protein [Clostridiales bacterium]